jgi:dehydrogenase/reductase SDR family member 7B
MLSVLMSLSPKAVVLVSRDEAALARLQKTINETYPLVDVTVLPTDLASAEQVDALVAEIASPSTPPIDLLVLNSGLSSRGTFVDTPSSVDEKLMRVNFLSQASLAKSVVANHMAPSGAGSIVWISSVQGFLPLPNRSSYVASKHAVEGYTASMRAELVHSGITVHTVSPGYVKTNLSVNAVTEAGTPSGVIDSNHQSAPPPEAVAWTILDNVSKGSVEFDVVAGFKAKAARWIRFLAPGVYRGIMEKRAADNCK